jgi:hypothetical protein
MIEAGEPQFKEGVLRIHPEFDPDGISAETFFRVLTKFRDKFIDDLKWSIKSNTPLWLGLEVIDPTDTADDIYGAAETLNNEGGLLDQRN